MHRERRPYRRWEENLSQELAAAGDFASVPALLARNVKEYGDRPAYREKEFGIWQSWTWAEAAEEIQNLALGLLALGIDRGDHVAIIGRNRPAHYWAMVAAQKVGAVPVPLYQDAVVEEMEYVLEHCGARFRDLWRSRTSRQSDRGSGQDPPH